MIESWSFAQPWALGGLSLLFGYAMLRTWRRKRDFQPFAPLQYRQGRPRRRWFGWVWLPVELLVLAAAIIALAGPHRLTNLELIEDEGIDVALVLDVSLSMLAEDFAPNRLESLREIANDFISRSGGHRIALIMFARDAFVQTPLTADHGVLRELLSGVTVDAIDQALSGGTAIGDALLVTGRHLALNKLEGRDQAVVLITDGESNMGSDPILAARYLDHLGSRLYAVGVGGTEPIEVFVDGERLGGDDPYLAYLDDRQLREVTAAGGGRFFRATDAGALEEIFGELSRLESAPLEVVEVNVREFFTRYFALAALPLFCLGLWLGGVELRRPYR